MPRTVPPPLLQPWAITQQGMELVWGVWSRGEVFAAAKEKALQALDGKPLQNAHETTVRDGVAIIPVYGPLCRHANMFSAISGATSYASLRKDFQKALDDPSVLAILLDVNSPGGEVDGCGELAAAIFAARGRKLIWSYVGGMGASAACWLYTATEKAVCAETAMLGSIGVRSSLVDDSKRDEREGVRSIELISSQSPGKRDSPIDDEVIAKAQAHVDKLAAIFISAVALHRGVSVEDVQKQFGRGDILIGQDAVDAGLADEIGNFEQTLAELATEARKGPRPGATAAAVVPASTPKNAAKAAGDTKMPKNLNKAAFRADGTPPEPMPKGKKAEDEKDPIEGAADDDTTADDGDEDEDDKPKGESDEDPDAEADDEPMEGAEDDEKQEKAATKALARKLGLPATASRKEVLMAAAAGAVPTATLDAKVEKLVDERFEERARKDARAQAKNRAMQLATAAVRGGYDPQDKQALIDYAKVNYAAAERIAAPYIAKERALLERSTVAGAPIGAARGAGPVVGGDMQEKKVAGYKVIKHGLTLSAEAKKRAAKDKIPYEAALDLVVKEQPELYATYLENLS